MNKNIYLFILYISNNKRKIIKKIYNRMCIIITIIIKEK